MQKFRTLLGDTALYGLGSIAQKVIGVLLLPIFTSYLSSEDYGLLAMTTLVSTFLLMLVIRPFASALARFYYQYYDEEKKKRQYVGNLFYLSLACTILVIAIAFLIRQPIAYLISNDISQIPFISQLLSLICLTALCDYVIRFYTTLVRVERKPTQYLIVTVALTSLTFALNLYLVVVAQWGVLGMIVGSLIASTVGCLVTGAIIQRQIDFYIDFQEFMKAVRFGFPLLPSSLFQWLGTTTNRYLINYFLSLSIVGLFSMASRISDIFNLILISVVSAWTPTFYQWASLDDRGKDISRAFRMYFILFLLASVGIGLFGREALWVLTDSKFHEAWIAIPLLAMGALFLGIKELHIPAIGQANKPKWLILTTGIGLLATIIISLIAIPRYGIIGAAISITASSLIQLVLTYFVGQSVYPIEYETKKVAFATGLGVLVIGSAYLVAEFPLNYAIALKVSFFIMLCLSLLALKLVSWQTIVSFSQTLITPILPKGLRS
jgi:O-antigen/teichoic acid export membrane protein